MQPTFKQRTRFFGRNKGHGNLAQSAPSQRVLLPALLTVQALALIRNIIVARSLGPEQFGLAMTFILAQQFIEMSTESGLNKFILQHRFGNRPSIQATVQALSAIRGGLVATLLLIVAWPIFLLLDITASVLPFAMLAVASLAMSFIHFDNSRQQRDGRFRNESISNVVGEVCGLVACIAYLSVSQTYLAVLLGIMMRSLFVATTSHILADRRYALRYRIDYMKVIFGFSWPLLVNGPILFLSTQFDRVMVTGFIGLRELGIYSATLLLVMLPLGLLTRMLGTIYIPRLSQALRTENGSAVEAQFAGVCLVFAILAGSGFVAVGPFALRILYGADFVQSLLPVALIGLAQAVRFLRTWPSGIAIATGHTSNVLISTIVRLAAMPMAPAGLLVSHSLTGLAAGLLVGEAFALIASLVLLNRARKLPVAHAIAPASVFVALIFLLPVSLVLTGAGPWLAIGLSGSLMALALLALYRINPILIPRDARSIGF